ncbi:bifunctional diguanylate cyclase/phosphodiesterase [Methylovulum psychrotolerans]|uniref:GGDEF domain-containing protein n=1 Tax=Methylovulum psychrotolerans TaxID=1704499 RepID=A0A2S5CSI4_9GAMM|nr:EAL domain-containing protein [Methylovulum psychrotolerans]POZ53781.1 GGDEF domain-containing protein [Methylovulum psychrotolerans]
MSALHDELVKILENEHLTPYFQPIVSVTHQKIIGYEALIRGPSGSPLYTPFVLFATADQVNLSGKLEYLSREISLRHYADLNLPEKLFINVSPNVLLHPDFKEAITRHFHAHLGLKPASVVIEITEHQVTDNYERMRNVIRHCRDMGFQIALDDLGAGYSGLRLWTEVRPDYVKIDKHFIEGLHNDAVKTHFVRSIQTIASSMHCQVIAEGVETTDEFRALERLGIRYMQGFYFAKPASVPLGALDAALFQMTGSRRVSIQPLRMVAVAQITQHLSALPSGTSVADVLDWFQHNPELNFLPIVDGVQAVGVLLRERFFAKLFSSRYGLELYGKKSVRSFLDKPPLSFDQYTPVEIVSQQLTSNADHDKVFIVTHNGEYAGIGTVWDLLEEITRQQIHHAQHANPLTLLPGSVPINDYINRLLAEQQAFAVGYFDLDNFKPFNDVYGYNAGDGIIKAVADTLQRAVSSRCGLVGHIGGDDFIVVFTGEDWLGCCEEMLASFAEQVPHHYRADDVKAGGIYAEDRAGAGCFFPLISLSVGVVAPNMTERCQSHVEVADLAAVAKKSAKQITGNSCFVSRGQKVLQ